MGGGGVGGGIGGFLGSIFGDYMAGDDASKQRDAAEKALQEMQGVHGPDFDKMHVDPNRISYSAYEMADPSTRAAQMQALGRMQNVMNQGGMTAQDKARMMEAQSGNEARERGSREAILQHMQARGGGGSGAELAAQLANEQGSAARGSMAGTQAAGEADQRALHAMQMTGHLGGQVRGQDYQKAAAQDALARFNADASNQAKYYNSNLGQTKFQDDLARAKGMGGAYQDYGNYWGGQAQKTRDKWSGIGQGVGSAVGAAAGDFSGVSGMLGGGGGGGGGGGYIKAPDENY